MLDALDEDGTGVFRTTFTFLQPGRFEVVFGARIDGAQARASRVVLVSAAAALMATGLAHLLLVATPRPLSFFNWIVGLVTLLMVLFPFSTSAPMSQKIATATVDLVIGFAIGSLLNGVGARATRRRPLPPPGGTRYDAPYGHDPYGQWPAQPPSSSGRPDPRDYPGRGRGPAN